MANRRAENDAESVETYLTPSDFAARYRSVYARLVLVAASITGDRVIAEDIAQDAAVIAYRKIKEFRSGSDFAAWLTEIVRRCSLNYVRKRKGRGTFATDPHGLDVADEPQSPGDVLDSAGKLRKDQVAFDDRIVAALSRLDEVPRTCLLLRVVQQLSFRELASQLRIPEGTAMSHVHRSKLAVRAMLSDEINRTSEDL